MHEKSIQCHMILMGGSKNVSLQGMISKASFILEKSNWLLEKYNPKLIQIHIYVEDSEYSRVFHNIVYVFHCLNLCSSTSFLAFWGIKANLADPWS